MSNFKILVEKDSELYRLYIRYLLKKQEFCLRQKSKDKRNKEAEELIRECHSIVLDTFSSELGWDKWFISIDGYYTLADLRRGNVSVYLEGSRDGK